VDSQAASLGKLILIQGEILLAVWLVSEFASAWAVRVAIVFFTGAKAKAKCPSHRAVADLRWKQLTALGGTCIRNKGIIIPTA
jgi:hypothetical protein